jgi:ribosome-associated translation inhibitor RaiA
VSNDKYYQPIHDFLTEKGEQGVNAIARYIDLPLASVQAYLLRQTYFKKTETRKWDLPDRVNNKGIKTDTLAIMLNQVENAQLLAKAQLNDMYAELEKVIDDMTHPINTLKRGFKQTFTPVAAEKVDIDQQLTDLDKDIKATYEVFKKYVGKCPEEYRDLIKNVDLYRLSIKVGTNYVNDEFTKEMTGLFLGKTTELSDNTLKMIEIYQKES